MERDPRKDPRVGDVVRVTDGENVYMWAVTDVVMSSTGPEFVCCDRTRNGGEYPSWQGTIVDWMTWASYVTVEVEHVADGVSSRDPRVEPKAGDVLTHDGHGGVVLVLRVSEDGSVSASAVAADGQDGRFFFEPDVWRRTFADFSVLRVGP